MGFTVQKGSEKGSQKGAERPLEEYAPLRRAP